MTRIFLFIFLSFLAASGAGATPIDLPPVTHYSLEVRLFPAEDRLETVATMTITNNTAETFSEVPFLLYRLLDVQKVNDSKAPPLEFEQKIVRLGASNLQANLITIHLSEPLAPGAAVRMTIHYRGSIFGYPEVMGYVNDRVSEKYSLIRPDALAYPMLAQPTFESLGKAYGLDVPFTYDLKVTVPDGYIVACGGAQLKITAREGLSTFTFKSKVPTGALISQRRSSNSSRTRPNNLPFTCCRRTRKTPSSF